LLLDFVKRGLELGVSLVGGSLLRSSIFDVQLGLLSCFFPSLIGDHCPVVCQAVAGLYGLVFDSLLVATLNLAGVFVRAKLSALASLSVTFHHLAFVIHTEAVGLIEVHDTFFSTASSGA